MKATDIRKKTFPYSGQNPSRLDMSFLAIYVLVTRGPVAPHCARMLVRFAVDFFMQNRQRLLLFLYLWH